MYHFVAGKKETEEEQYDDLHEILKYGWLSFSPHEKSLNPRQIEINTHKDRKIKEMFNPYVVCFADIPKTELQIHIDKCSRFGIAFKKSFLIENGANPVFYIEENSIIYKNYISYLGKYELTNRVNYYQKFCGMALHNIFHKHLNNSKPDEFQDTLESWHFLVNVFSHFKVWNNNLDEHDPDNYYFEREWRATNNINFQSSDVVNIIIPEKCIKQFEIDFPELINKVIKTEDIEKGA